jgi:hypothetical protein
MLRRRIYRFLERMKVVTVFMTSASKVLGWLIWAKSTSKTNSQHYGFEHLHFHCSTFADEFKIDHFLFGQKASKSPPPPTDSL